MCSRFRRLDDVTGYITAKCRPTTVTLVTGLTTAKLGHPLRGRGVPEDFITDLLSLIETIQPLQYRSCFISDSSQAELSLGAGLPTPPRC